MATPNSEYKYRILISIDNYKNCGGALVAGSMTWDSIHNYLQNLSGKQIPENSCLEELTGAVSVENNITMHMPRARPASFSARPFPTNFRIDIKLHNCKKCAAKSCKKNISTGKCTDPFVIENIGMKFFQDAYQKQK